MEGITVSKQPGGDLDELLKTPWCDSFILSNNERRMLKLWDQEEDLRLERALYEARSQVSTADLEALSEDDLEAQVKMAENEALEARASHVLRNRIIQQTVVTDPILKTVHTGANEDPISHRLLGLVHERDVLAMVNAKLSRDLQAASTDLTNVEQQNVNFGATNQGVAATLLSLAEDTRGPKSEEIDDLALRSELQSAETEVQGARRDWRIMKSVVVSVVVGSGINWAEQDALIDLILDDEDDLS